MMTQKTPADMKDLENVSGGTAQKQYLDELHSPQTSDNLENCPFEPKSRYRKRKKGTGPKVPLY